MPMAFLCINIEHKNWNKSAVIKVYCSQKLFYFRLILCLSWAYTVLYYVTYYWLSDSVCLLTFVKSLQSKETVRNNKLVKKSLLPMWRTQGLTVSSKWCLFSAEVRKRWTLWGEKMSLVHPKKKKIRALHF